MTDYSPRQQELPGQTMKPEPQQQNQNNRLCDYCNDTTALLYCRADSAKLCLSCDREVHSTNQLFSKHTRSKLCDACDDSPASIFCETERSVFCQNCDWERHNLSLLHNRRPIEGFSGCPSVSELVTNLGFEDVGDEKALLLNEESNKFLTSELDGSDFRDGYSDFLVWESPPVVSIDDLIVPRDSGQNLQALGVPPLPKNRNAACGQHKGEMLRQLRQLAKLDSNNGDLDSEPVNMFRPWVAEECTPPGNMYAGYEPDTRPMSFPAYEENVLHWLNDSDEAANQAFLASPSARKNSYENLSIPDKQSNITGSVLQGNDGHGLQTQLPVPTRMLSTFPKFAPHELNTQERDSAISRYKEKRKTRRYDKHIRYESRKARAESRTRIRGRFAKTDH